MLGIPGIWSIKARKAEATAQLMARGSSRSDTFRQRPSRTLESSQGARRTKPFCLAAQPPPCTSGSWRLCSDIQGRFLPRYLRSSSISSFPIISFSLHQLLGENADFGCPSLHVQNVENKKKSFTLAHLFIDEMIDKCELLIIQASFGNVKPNWLFCIIKG